MENTSPSQETCKHKKHYHHNAGGTGTIYGLAFIGAAVYYIQHADTFLTGALGVLKALTWPALLIYKLLTYFQM